MENFSKNRKRGRPPIFDPVSTELSNAIWDDGPKSRRGLQNYQYMTRALAAMGNERDTKYRWLYSPEKVRFTILYELGRLQDEEDIRDFAEQICEMKPKSKDAVAMIRNWRLGREKTPGNIDTLTQRIIDTLDDYRETHEANLDMVHDALAEVIRTINVMRDICAVTSLYIFSFILNA